MSALAEKIRKAREVRVMVDDMTLIVRRPTDLEMIELRGAKMGRAILPFVAGWENVSELSMLGNGSPHPIDYDAAACAAWLEDRIDILGRLVDEAFKAYSAHQEALSSAVKN